jgi:DNA polymerase I-like protein with 3'-5' exonuclease and polymerase domains
MGLKTIGQFHDEIIVLTKEGDEDKTENIMQMSINNVNDAINLNVPLGTDVQFGNTYADIH